MSGNVVELTTDNFDSHTGDGLFLVDFWAEWCAPCRAIAPHVESIANEMSDKVKVGKLNIDDQGEISTKFGVRSIPTLILFKNGEPVDQMVGALPKEKIEAWVQAHA